MIKCPKCGSTNIQRRGYSKTEEPKQRIRCSACGQWSDIDLPESTEREYARSIHDVDELTKRQKFIITSAQNNTALHHPFWESINQYAKHNNAQIIVIPIRYFWQEDKSDFWYPKEVIPYLYDNEIHLHDKLWVMGNVQVQATAVNPVSGLDSLSKNASAIFGHAQIQMKTIPTPQAALPKIIQTTGSTSVKNYSNTKAGIKGEFHHSLGAVVVDISNTGKFHMRSVVGDNKGEFYDLQYRYTPSSVKSVDRIEALITGDEHAMFTDPKVKKATYTNKDSIVNTLKPNIVVRHDVIDSYSISHHHKQDPVTQFKKWYTGDSSLEKELKVTAEYLEDTTPKDAKNYIVYSNHHKHIDRWLKETDPKQEPWNAKLYHNLMAEWLERVEKEEDFMPFQYALRKYMSAELNNQTEFLKENEVRMIKDIMISEHGHRGPNGARGSISNLRNIGVKTIIGHTHSPGIDKGCYQVGTSSELELEYTTGPSSWLNTHAVIYPNGKRQLIHIIDGEWR